MFKMNQLVFIVWQVHYYTVICYLDYTKFQAFYHLFYRHFWLHCWPWPLTPGLDLALSQALVLAWLNGVGLDTVCLPC